MARTVTETTTATVHGWRLWGSYPGIPGSTESDMILDGEEEEEDEGSGSQETAGFRVLDLLVIWVPLTGDSVICMNLLLYE
jgi:hypothetical protein